MSLKNKLNFSIILTLFLFFGKNLIGQSGNNPTYSQTVTDENAPTNSNTNKHQIDEPKTSNNKKSKTIMPVIEVKKKVFFDVDWKTWFVFREVEKKPLVIRLFSNKLISGHDVHVKDKLYERKLDRDIIASKSKITYKTRVKYPDNKTIPNSAIYLKNKDGSQSNEISIEIAFRRFSASRLKFEALRQDVEFEQMAGGKIVQAATTRSSINLNYHIVDFLFGVAGGTVQYNLGDNTERKNTFINIDNFKADDFSYGYFFKLKPIRLGRLLVAPYYLRQFYKDKYTFNDGGIPIDKTNLIETTEDQFGIDALLLFKNKRKNKHEILNLTVFYQYANQTNTSDFLLRDKRGFGVGLNYSFWFNQ